MFFAPSELMFSVTLTLADVTDGTITSKRPFRPASVVAHGGPESVPVYADDVPASVTTGADMRPSTVLSDMRPFTLADATGIAATVSETIWRWSASVQ